MELYGVIWSYMELYGVMWSYMELYGVMWSYMELYGVIWSYMELCGVMWSYMELYGVIWVKSLVLPSLIAGAGWFLQLLLSYGGPFSGFFGDPWGQVFAGIHD